MQGGSSTTGRRRDGVLAVPGLIGFALSLFALGTIQRFETLLRPSVTLTHVTVLVTLCCLAMGIWLPNRFARSFYRLTLRYRPPAKPVPSRCAGAPRRLVPARRDDDSNEEAITDAQLRVIGAASLVLSGLAMMMIGPMASKLGALYWYAADAFHWTLATHRALELALVAIYAAVPLGLLGIAFNCTQRVALLYSRRPLITLASLSAGLCIGLVLWPAANLGAPGFATVTTLISALVLLATGLAKLQLGRRGDLLSSESADLPVVSDRWRFVLIWVLVVGGVLTTSYIVAGQHFATLTARRPDVPLLLSALSLGIILSNTNASRWFRSLPGIALLCMLTSASITVAVCSVGARHALPLHATNEPAAIEFGFSLLRWGIISLPPVLMGLVLAMATAATVDRSARPSTGVLSSSLSICLGAALACLAVILRLGEGFSLFHLLVLSILLWLVLGGLLLIYEPQFGLRNRWIHASLMIAMLVVFTIVLPLQAPTWSIMRRQMRAASVGALQTAVSYIDADRVVGAARASQATATSSPGWETRTGGDRAQATATVLMPVDAMLEILQISKERYAAIIITPPSAPSRYFSDEMQTALIQAAASKLRRDGVFVTQFHDSPSHHEAVFEHWRRQVERTFGSTEVITESIAHAGMTRGTRLLIASYDPKQHTRALVSREQALSHGAGGP